jgi:hypothetical protein
MGEKHSKCPQACLFICHGDSTHKKTDHIHSFHYYSSENENDIVKNEYIQSFSTGNNFILGRKVGSKKLRLGRYFKDFLVLHFKFLSCYANNPRYLTIKFTMLITVLYSFNSRSTIAIVSK